jgi:two-component system, LytTR family, sensor kinase
MERLANYILHLYPIDHVPFKRRATLHIVFWILFYIFYWFGVGFPSDTIVYRFVTATSITLTTGIFFYILAYLIPYLYSKSIGLNRVLGISVIFVAFYFFLAIETHIRVTLIIENHWLSAQNRRMYGEISKAYNAGFWHYFKFEIILSDTFFTVSNVLPAFFLKFMRVFAKNLSEKKQLEIDFLRLQINPHFLVNTLNNIYSLVVTEDKRSPDAIMSLSNLLDYVLYESSSPTVTVEKEVTFLQDFVALEHIRNSSKVQVKMNVEGEQIGNIAPLILIAFIENAFKHGVGDSTIQSYVHINIKVENNTLFLGVINSKVRKVSEKQKKSLGGIGLVNVKKRLDSLYPNRHSLQVISDPNKHQIVLLIVLT